MSSDSRPQLVVKDANIFIDLVNAGMLDLWCATGIATLTTDFVVSELKAGPQWGEAETLIESGAIEVAEFAAEETLQIHSLRAHHRVSMADGSVLYLSMSREARLLTGDRRLRRAAEKAGVEVGGLLWVIDELVAKSLLSPETAAERLRDMLNRGARLPDHEVEVRLNRWSEP